jgi:hypothetical protein
MEEMQAVEDSFLEHSGVKNMKWGQRRYQNPDGSLTALGRIHYGIGQRRAAKAAAKKTKVMQSGDIKTVLKYRKKLTDEEFDTAMNRVAKTEALRSKERAEKEAKQRAKDESKAAKDQIKLRKEALDNAKDIAKIEAKTKVKQAKSGNLIKKGLAIATSIAGAYGTYKKVALMISDLTGKDLPGVNNTTLFGKKDGSAGNTASGSGSKDKPKNATKASASRAEGVPFTEKKSEASSKAFDDISDDAWDMGKKAFNDFKSTSTASDTFSSFVEGIGRSAANSGKEHRTSDHNFWDGVGEIIDADWTEVKSTPVSDILALPYNDKWLK